MLNKKEILIIILISIIFAFSITLMSSLNYFLIVFLSIILVIMINIITKKIIGYYYEMEIETKLWEFKHWGYKPKQHLKKDFPAGAFFPIFSRVILFPLNGFIWMASLVFDVKAKVYKTAKRHGFYSFSEVSGNQIAYTAAAGIFANLLFAILGYLIGFSEFAKFNIWFSFFNIIPLSNLDGNKIFFGSKTLWTFLTIIILIALIYTFFII